MSTPNKNNDDDSLHSPNSTKIQTKTDEKDIERQIVEAVKKLMSEQIRENSPRGKVAVSLHFTPQSDGVDETVGEMSAADIPVPTTLHRTAPSPGAFAQQGPGSFNVVIDDSSSSENSYDAQGDNNSPLVTATLVIDDDGEVQFAQSAPNPILVHAEPMSRYESSSPRVSGLKRKLSLYGSLLAMIVIIGLVVSIVVSREASGGQPSGDTFLDMESVISPTVSPTFLPDTSISTDSEGTYEYDDDEDDGDDDDDDEEDRPSLSPSKPNFRGTTSSTVGQLAPNNGPVPTTPGSTPSTVTDVSDGNSLDEVDDDHDDRKRQR